MNGPELTIFVHFLICYDLQRGTSAAGLNADCFMQATMC